MVNQKILRRYLDKIEHQRRRGRRVNSIKFNDPIRFAEFLDVTVFEVHAEYGDPPYEIEIREYDAEEGN